MKNQLHCLHEAAYCRAAGASVSELKRRAWFHQAWQWIAAAREARQHQEEV